jgi:hypothetical protein
VVDNQSDFFSLKRLILLDSYRRGRKAEVRLDGHTSFNGGNAAGKTSLLRLIPMFYGESPNKLVHGGGVTQSFVAHYLPHSSSYIIFEYGRRGTDCMVVMHASKAGDSVYYRFIDQPFDIARFVDEADEPIIGADLNRHITKRGEFCSEQITALTDYRSIIQNTVRKKEHRPLAARFAFVGAGSRLGHIEKIVTGMFSRVTNFLDLKRIIVSCIADEGQSLRLESNKSAMDSWIKEYRAYQAVMAHSGRMKALGESALRHEAAAGQLREVHAEFLLIGRQHEATIGATEDRMKDLDEMRAALDEEARRQLDSLGLAMGTVNGSIKTISKQIDAFEARRDQYAKEGIEEVARLVDELPRLAEQVRELKEREEALLGKSGGLATRYGRMKNDRTTRANEFANNQDALKDPIRRQADTERERLAEESKAKWASTETKFRARETTLQDERSTISEEVGVLRHKAANPQPGQKYTDAVTNAQDELNKAAEMHLAALKAYEASEQAYLQEVQEFDSIDKNIGRLNKQHGDEEGRLQHLQTLASATAGTLLHFLREHRPNWGSDIARVVPEDLLLRTDLDPSLTGDAGGGLYGVSLDLSVIDAPRAASEEALHTQVEASERATHQLSTDIKVAEKDLESQSDRMNAAKDKSSNLNAARIAAEAHEKACKTALDAALRALKEDRHQAGMDAARQLRDKEAELKQTNEAIKLLQEAMNEQRHGHENALKAAHKQVFDNAEAEIATIDKAIRDEREACARDLKVLDAELDSALKAEGVDVESLSKLRKDIAIAENRLGKARDGIAPVGAWRNWVRDEWSRLGELKVELTREQAEAQRLAGEELSTRREREARNGVLTSQHDEAKRERDNAVRFLEFVNTRCGRLTEWPADRSMVESRSGPSKSQDALEAEMDRALAEISKERASARKEVDVIRAAMFEHADTAPFDFYERSRKALGPDQESGSPFVWVKPLQEWFDTANVDARRLLLSQCRTFSQDIHEFHDRLDKFKRQVSIFSNDLQDKMSKAIYFRSIRGVSARLTTSFDTLEGWDKIKNLDAEYTVWAGVDSNELPPDSFAMAVGDVHRFLQGRHLEVKLEDLIGIEIDIDEAGQPKKTVKDEMQLKDVSSNGLSYLILCVVFVGLINQIRRNEPIKLVWALDELRDLDIGNVQALLEMLAQNHIHLVSAFPDPDPDILSLIKNRYTIEAGRKIVTFQLPEEVSHV